MGIGALTFVHMYTDIFGLKSLAMIASEHGLRALALLGAKRALGGGLADSSEVYCVILTVLPIWQFDDTFRINYRDMCPQ